MRIGPNDILEPGTEVRVGAMRGVVVGHEEHDARPSGKIIVHEVKMTERAKVLFGSKLSWELMDRPLTLRPNYSFVTVLNPKPGNK